MAEQEDPAVARAPGQGPNAEEEGAGPPVVRVRYRAGFVGESRRVVHVGADRGDAVVTGCELTIPADQIEHIEYGGMPCMSCMETIVRAALKTTRAVER